MEAMAYSTKRVRQMSAEEAAKFGIELRVFHDAPGKVSRETLVYLLDTLPIYFGNKYVREFEFRRHTNALRAEWSKRLSAGDV